jgi:hypothetical protein
MQKTAAEKLCAACARKDVELSICSGCRKVYYCSADCQKGDRAKVVGLKYKHLFHHLNQTI